MDSSTAAHPSLFPQPASSTKPPVSAPTSRPPTLSSDEDRSSEDDANEPWNSGTSVSSLDQSETSSSSTEIAPHATMAVKGSDGESQPKPRSRRSSSSISKSQSHDNVNRLSAAAIQELANSPESLPVAPAPPQRHSIDQEWVLRSADHRDALRQSIITHPDLMNRNGVAVEPRSAEPHTASESWYSRDRGRRPAPSARTLSTPPISRNQNPDVRPSASSPRRYSFHPVVRPAPLHLKLDLPSAPATSTGTATNGAFATPTIKSASPAISVQTVEAPLPRSAHASNPPSPIPPIIPLPPMSLPTHLQLELAAQRPSPLYIHHSAASDIPYESSAVKFERLKNVLLLPAYLERTLHFGALACLDAWLHTFTILPIRFIIAVSLLVRWWLYLLAKETRWLVGFVWYGLGRLWSRGAGSRKRRLSDVSEGARSRSHSGASEMSVDVDTAASTRNRLVRQRTNSRVNNHITVKPPPKMREPGSRKGFFRHRRTKSVPSTLSAFHKADILQGAVIICSSIALMKLDASRMYHFIRAQSAIKLYVIYNILEVSDRLLSAVGQDILECLFSTETLSRNASGRSKVLMPLGMFLLALAYSCLHSITLYYQVITLNVAVNSYSNALLTLLLSNQFVEIKSTVFKRFEKDNLFQLTCADIVERFHLWIMLLIIGMRNVVEVGGLSIPGAGSGYGSDEAVPLHNPSILPHSFTVLPSWIMSGEVLSPFLIVIGSEMLVDSIKHAYVTKFNNIKPTFYSRTLDILCKDYYTNAFTTPALTRRLGLAVIPLSCLFIRASVQTYHMFLATHVSVPLPQSTATSLTEESAAPSSPAMIAALNRFDTLIRDSLGRATYGYPYGSPLNSRSWYSWTSDDFIAALTMVVVFFIAFLVLLIVKLLLGMVLLKYSRRRYAKMKMKEHLVATGKAERESYDATGRRVGGHGEVEVGDDRQRWIHADKTEGLKGGKGPGGKRASSGDKKKPEGDYNGVFRYEMVAKRIW